MLRGAGPQYVVHFAGCKDAHDSAGPAPCWVCKTCRVRGVFGTHQILREMLVCSEDSTHPTANKAMAL